MTHYQINNLLSGHIWTYHKHRQYLLVTYWHLMSLAWMNLFLLISEVCEVSTLMTRLALKFLCWTLETFNMNWISTLLASVLVLEYILGINALLVITLPVTHIILLTCWSRLHKGLPVLVLACWEVCVLTSHQIEPPGVHMPPVWCAWWSPLNSPTSLQAAWPCL